MNKREITEYLRNELAELKKECDRINENYAKADHMDRMGMATSKDKVEDKYYHFWMICNDLGIVERGL